jgi:hypothetical protein
MTTGGDGHVTTDGGGPSIDDTDVGDFLSLRLSDEIGENA